MWGKVGSELSQPGIEAQNQEKEITQLGMARCREQARTQHVQFERR